MSATNDRRFAEVGRALARWLAEHDPRATPLIEAVGRPDLHRMLAVQLEALLGDALTWFARGYLAGVAFAQDPPNLFGAQS